jgi:hypothetical protein
MESLVIFDLFLIFLFYNNKLNYMEDNNKLNYKLTFRDDFIFENDIQGNIYKLMFQLYQKLLFKNMDKFFDNSFDIYPYFFSYESNNPGKKQRISQNFKFLKYKPLIGFFRINEIIKLYFNKIIDENFIISEITNYTPVLCEVLMYNNYKIKNLNFITTDKKILSDLIEKISKIYSFDVELFKDSIYNLVNFEKIKKSNLILYTIYQHDSYFKYIDGFYNIVNLFAGLLIAIKFVKINGSFIIKFDDLNNKAQADIYLILKNFYKESYLYYPEICSHTKRGGTYAIFKYFKGITNDEYDKLYKMFEKIKDIYPNNINDFNIYNLEQRVFLETTKPIDKYNIKPYITGFLNLNENNNMYEEIKIFNEKKYINHYIALKKLEILFQDQNDAKNAKLSMEDKIKDSMMYCNKWGIEYFTNNKMIDGMNKEILNEMYGNIEPINYKFKTPYQTKILPKIFIKTLKSKKSNNIKKKTKKSSQSKSKFYFKKINLETEMFEINNIISQTGYMIDSRRDFSIKDESKQLGNYFKANVLFRFYKSSGKDSSNNLSTIVRNKIGRNVSQAWLKFYEVLAETNIIPKNKSRYESFHLCEAPGSFIDCLDYYIKKETNIKDFNWNAQSYKPTKGKPYFGDDFGIMKKYPDQWHWGKDGTGDITKCDNILSYKELCKDVDLITSDCGIPMNQPGYERILFSSMFAMTYLLPIGGSIVFKILTPINKPIVWNIIYLWFNSFKEFRFFKPIQNNQSREFYIIGKGFLGIEQSIMKKLIELVKDKTDKFMKVDLFDDKYPEPFVHQIINISFKLAENWAFTIQKQIYYSDNMELLENDKSFMKMVKHYIKEKNLDFIEKYNLIKLK